MTGPLYLDLAHAARADLIRQILRSIGFAGPYGRGATTLELQEGRGWSVFATPGGHGLARFGATQQGPATVVLASELCNTSALFPLFGDVSAVSLSGALDSKSILARRRGEPAILAMRGRNRESEVLALGFNLSDALTRITEGNRPWGWGHLRVLLQAWFEHIDRAPRFYLSPWPRSAPPLLCSFDVETNVGQRSTGKRVWGVGTSARDLAQYSLLDRVQPLRMRRLALSRNRVADGDREFRSLRVTVDARRAPRGCFPESLQVRQHQVQFMVARRRHVVETDYGEFVAWVNRELPWATLFLSGVRSAESVEARWRGYHGFLHRHFSSASGAELAEEFHDASTRFFAAETVSRPLRAPGLIWSPTHRDLVGQFGFTSDHSVTEVNRLQPLAPFMGRGWAHMPVTANSLTVPDLDRVAAMASATNSYVSLYTHDAELIDETSRAELLRRMRALESSGFAPTTTHELEAWLAERDEHEIHVHGDAVALRGKATPGTAVAIRGRTPEWTVALQRGEPSLGAPD